MVLPLVRRPPRVSNVERPDGHGIRAGDGDERVKFHEIEKTILADGWVFKNAKGSHCQYVHPTKPGKVTIPCHSGDIPPIVIKSILKQAGL
jgi:predicted RNA binding protein YcfA (HicA-like mRNA interferase family)